MQGMRIIEIFPYNIVFSKLIYSYFHIFRLFFIERLFQGEGENNFNYYNNTIV